MNRRATGALRCWACAATAVLVGSLFLVAGAGCATSEHSAYVRHLTTVVEPSNEIPEEVALTFDLDRRPGAPSGAIARGSEQGE